MSTVTRRGLIAAAGTAIAAVPMSGAIAAARSEAGVPVLRTYVTGVTSRTVAAARPKLADGAMLHLVREPDNDYDARAVAVFTPEGVKLGYVPRVENQPIANLMDAGLALGVRLTEIRPTGPRPDLRIEIDLVLTRTWSGAPPDLFQQV